MSSTEDDPCASSHWRLRFEQWEKQPFYGLGEFEQGTFRTRIADWILQYPWRSKCDADLYRRAREIAVSQQRPFGLGILRHVLALGLIRQHMKQSPAIVTVIGDGFGFMSALLHRTYPQAQLIVVNLTKSLEVDMKFLRRAGIEGSAFPSGQVTALEARNADQLRAIPVDLAINTASMQEMNPSEIQKYFDILRSHGRTHFYCANRLDKQLPDGTVTRFMEYPWRAADLILVDEACPWYRRYYSYTPPFYRTYEFRVWHRFAKLSRQV
jgi:hypothetical protein